MNKFLTFSTSTTLLLGAFLITGCSSSDDGGTTSGITFDGTTTAAVIDDTNAEAIGTAAGESVQKADSSTGLPGAITISTAADMDQINNIVLSTYNLSTLPTGVDISAQTCTTGSASVSDPGVVTSGAVDVTTTYTNCAAIGSDITIDGVAVMHIDNFADINAGFSITYIDFTVTDPINGTTTINMTVVCDNAGCTFNSDFVGTDGVIHRITNFSIFGDASIGFSGSATFFHGTYGEVSITISGITYAGSCGSIPNGGTIAFDSTNGSSGTIIFNSDCTVSGSWDNGSGLGGTF